MQYIISSEVETKLHINGQFELVIPKDCEVYIQDTFHIEIKSKTKSVIPVEMEDDWKLCEKDLEAVSPQIHSFYDPTQFTNVKLEESDLDIEQLHLEDE